MDRLPGNEGVDDSDMSPYDIIEVEEIDCDDILEEIDVEGEPDEDNEMESGDIEEDSLPLRDDSDCTFTKHEGAVFCCHLHPKISTIAVSGSEDEKAYVWNTTNGEILFECSNNKDSVIAAEFSSDGTYLATGDMSGVLQVWKVETKALVWSNSIGEDLVWLKWHPVISVLFCAASSGEIYFWKMPDGVCKVIPSYGDTCSCGAIMPDGLRGAFGYSKGDMMIYDLKTMKALATLDVEDFSPNCIDIHVDNNLVVSGGADGRVVVYKTQPAKVVAIFTEPQNLASQPGDTRSTWVEAVQFCPDPNLHLVAAATLSGKLFIWEVTKKVLRHTIVTSVGISRMIWDKHSSSLYAGLLDGSVKIYDGRNGNLQSQLLGHKDNILDISLSRDGSILLTSSEDKSAKVFSLLTPDR